MRDLLGPAGGPEEVISERNVRGRYLVGMLAPKGQSALPEESDEELTEEPGDEGDVAEERPPKAAVSMLPSSIGLSFEVSDEAEAIQVTARWGWYERVTVEEEAYRRKEGDGYYPVWKRRPVEAISPPIPLHEGAIPLWEPSAAQPDVYVQGRIRRRDGGWSVTLFLVNAQQEPQRNKDSAWLFQPALQVETPDGAAVFRRRPLNASHLDPEEHLMAMLYRDEVEFAVGHGVAVAATRDGARRERARRLCTVVLPHYDVPQTTTPTIEEIPALAGLALSMKALSELPDGSFAQHLSPLTTAYTGWIEALQARVAHPAPDLLPFLGVAQGAVEQCQRTLVRIQEGIALLDQNPEAAEAFRFANRAMHLQRLRSLYAASVRQGSPRSLGEMEEQEPPTWRTFQLAFLLLNLPSLANPTHPDRALAAGELDAGQSVADLLWFPTGGGKTEAYLGVAAFTMAIRRLQGVVAGRDGRAGVAVLMRYTLRLLTLQQFQRAATLLCACEIIRREAPQQLGRGALSPGAVGRAAHHPEPHRGCQRDRPAAAPEPPLRRAGHPAPADQLPLVWERTRPRTEHRRQDSGAGRGAHLPLL